MRQSVLTGLLLVLGCQLGLGQSAKPEFTFNSVLPANASRPALLQPGMLVSIYGAHLGPVSGCTARPVGGPTELCGVRVQVGEQWAELLYVQKRQINLRVPYGAPIEGVVPFVVQHGSAASQPVLLRFGPETARIRVPATAYVHMPIWVAVDLPSTRREQIRYPMTIWPDDFGGHEFEVRLHGVALPRMQVPHLAPKAGSSLQGLGAIGGGSRIGLPSEPQHGPRLPLHLLYRFDQSGVYEVRYTGYDERYPMQKEPLVRSDWVRLPVLPFSSGQRQAWLQQQKKAPADPVELLSEYLPSLLALPDSHTLPLVAEQLHHPNKLVREYALYALFLYEDRSLVDPLTRLIAEKGPSDQLAYFLSWRKDLFQSRGPALVQSIKPFLFSPSPIVVEGALQSLLWLQPQYDWSATPRVPTEIDRAVMRASGRLAANENIMVRQALELYLRERKKDHMRKLLRR